jgi:hypothetical protein
MHANRQPPYSLSCPCSAQLSSLRYSCEILVPDSSSNIILYLHKQVFPSLILTLNLSSWSTMATTLTHLDFPTTDPTHFVHIISNLLSEEECTNIIGSHADLVPSNLTLGTIRTRKQFEDRALRAQLWSRLKQFYDGNRIQDERGSWWVATGLNPNFRLSKYESSTFISLTNVALRNANIQQEGSSQLTLITAAN